MPLKSNYQSSPRAPAWVVGASLYQGTRSSLSLARPRDSFAGSSYDYVIKAPNQSLASEELQRMRNEVACGRTIRHAHLVPVFAGCTHPDRAYLVMPYLPGASAEQAITSLSRFRIETAVWICRQMCEALAKLHAENWLHGDVKPANILVSPDGHATLIDLGFARRIVRNQTVEGPLVGSIAYSAPELLTSDPLSPAADIYSLATTLFEMLTGRLPLEGESVEQLAEARLTQTPHDVRDYEPLVPRQIAWLLRRALSKLSIRRPSALEMRDSLAAAEIELMCQSPLAA